MVNSLYKACKKIYRSRVSGSEDVGGHTIGFELYDQSDIDANVEAITRGEATKCTFGDLDESKVVLVADSTLTIPSGFTLTPANPKKSLVILCNNLVNNGTISMTGKGPNILPHDWYILGKADKYGVDSNIIIPDYANNGVSFNFGQAFQDGVNGANGINRQCGSGGGGSFITPNSSTYYYSYDGKTGSGSAFAGGAGSGSGSYGGYVDTTYPMRGSNGNGIATQDGYQGGVGNPPGSNMDVRFVTYNSPQATGVGGRLIIYCVDFENNGTISANGVNSNFDVSIGDARHAANSGGASGGGCVDLFYNTLTTQGIITADGGAGIYGRGNKGNYKSGDGGDGCVTLLEWDIEKVVKPQAKYMSKDNMIYFLQGLVNRINGED